MERTQSGTWVLTDKTSPNVSDRAAQRMKDRKRKLAHLCICKETVPGWVLRVTHRLCPPAAGGSRAEHPLGRTGWLQIVWHPKSPWGGKGKGWEGQYLEPGRDDLLLTALHWVLAGNDGVDVVVRGGPQCMAPGSWHGSEGTARHGKALHTRPHVPSALYGLRSCRSRGPLSWEGRQEPPTAPLRLPWVIFPHQATALGRVKNDSNSIRGIWKHDTGCREITVPAITSDYDSLG